MKEILAIAPPNTRFELAVRLASLARDQRGPHSQSEVT